MGTLANFLKMGVVWGYALVPQGLPMTEPKVTLVLTYQEANLIRSALRMLRTKKEKGQRTLVKTFGDEVRAEALDDKQVAIAMCSDLITRLKKGGLDDNRS